MCPVGLWFMLPSIALDTPSSRSPTLCHLPILRSPGELVVQRPLVFKGILKGATHGSIGLMAPPGGRRGTTTHPGRLITREQERRSGSCCPAQRGDVSRARHFSRLCSPLSLGLPVLDVASPPSTLTLRACLRVAEVAARAGRSCVLLLLVLLWPPSLSGRLGSRSRRVARGSQPFGSPRSSARGLAGRRASAWPRAPRGRAGAREGKRRGRRVSRGPGRPRGCRCLTRCRCPVSGRS